MRYVINCTIVWKANIVYINTMKIGYEYYGTTNVYTDSNGFVFATQAAKT